MKCVCVFVCVCVCDMEQGLSEEWDLTGGEVSHC